MRKNMMRHNWALNLNIGLKKRPFYEISSVMLLNYVCSHKCTFLSTQMRTNMMRHDWGLNLSIGLKQVVIEVGLEILTFDSQNLYNHKN